MSLSERLNIGDTESAKAFPNIGDRAESITNNAPRTEAILLDEKVLLKQQVLDTLLNSLGQQLYSGQIDDKVIEEEVYKAISEVITASQISLSSMDRATLVQQIVDEILGLGPLQSLLRNSEITEVMVNGAQNIYVETYGKITKTNLSFNSEAHLRRTIERIVSQVGRRIDESSPMVDARLPDGSRVNAVVPPIAVDGSSLTIRKFSRDPFTARDLISTGTISVEAMEVLASLVRGKYNIVISGGTGSGKTTTLNVLSSFIGDDERIVTIEDAAELQMNQPHVVRMEARPVNTEGKGLVSIRDLVRNALRMRPDRIVVGEVRDAAALDMLQAMNTGHEGSLTTVHANSARDALMRIETMVLMAGMELPVQVIREQMVEAVDIIIQQSRMRDGSRKITQISEVIGIEGPIVQMQDLYTFKYNQDIEARQIGTLLPTGMVLSNRKQRATSNEGPIDLSQPLRSAK